MEDAEVFHLVERQVVAAEVEPAVEEHRTVPGGEDEAVAVEPTGLVRIVHQGMAVEDGADLGGTERQAKVAGRALVHGVDGEAAGLGGGLGENFGV